MEETLHRDLYLESSWFVKERENIFFDQWFCVGREDDLATTGSYRVVDLAGESILLVRGEDDQVRAFYNVCRHRGCQLIDSNNEDQLCGRFSPLEILVDGWTTEYQVAANWKVLLENYNECYHCAGVHPELCRIVPEFRRNGGAGLDWDICERVQRGMHARPFRHGLYAPMEDLSLDIRNYIATRLDTTLPSE